MHLAHAIAASHLAGTATERLHRSTAHEVAAAERRATDRARRVAAAAAAVSNGSATATGRIYTVRGRHVAPRPTTA